MHECSTVRAGSTYLGENRKRHAVVFREALDFRSRAGLLCTELVPSELSRSCVDVCICVHHVVTHTCRRTTQYYILSRHVLASLSLFCRVMRPVRMHTGNSSFLHTVPGCRGMPESQGPLACTPCTGCTYRRNTYIHVVYPQTRCGGARVRFSPTKGTRRIATRDVCRCAHTLRCIQSHSVPVCHIYVFCTFMIFFFKTRTQQVPCSSGPSDLIYSRHSPRAPLYL